MRSLLASLRAAFCLLACGASMGFAAPMADSQSAAAEDRSSFKGALESYIEAVEGQDCDAIVESVQTILAFTQVSSLPIDAIEELGLTGGSCAVQARKLDVADAIVSQTTEIGAPSPWLWAVRFEIPYFDDRTEDAFVVLQKMARASTGALDALKPEFLYGLDDQLDDKDMDEARHWLLALATSGAYQPAGVLTSVDGFRSRYARLLEREGNTPGAAAQIAAMERTHSLAGIYADPQLAALLPRSLDLRATARAEVERMRQAVVLYPDHLKPIVYLSGALRALGSYREARKLLAKVEDGGPIGERFIDANEHENWFWDEVGRTEMALGNADAAVIAYETGAAVGRETDDRVSQAINLAHAYVDLHRPAEALSVLARERPDEQNISPFGIMQVRLARGCAQTMLGNEAEALTDLEAMIEHRDEGESALAYLYLCRGNLDAAAEIYIHQLQDPDKRANARLTLAEFSAVPDGGIEPIYKSALNELRTRADMRAALENAGGAIKIPLQTTDF